MKKLRSVVIRSQIFFESNRILVLFPSFKEEKPSKLCLMEQLHSYAPIPKCHKVQIATFFSIFQPNCFQNYRLDFKYQFINRHFHACRNLLNHKKFMLEPCIGNLID